MSDYWFYGSSFAVFFASFFGYIFIWSGNINCRGFVIFYSFVSSVNNDFFYFFSIKPFKLLQYLWKRFRIVQCFRKIQCSHDDACLLIEKNRSFAAKLKFLMLFTFGITFYIRFMKAVNFIAVTLFLGQYSLVQFKRGQINTKSVQWQLTGNFPH